ncbi:non-ribosomal peptide synthetase [Methylorubrum suomiense]|uniref:non-ribosomal peptide synthetase n=1 Tax=Methylorubrum suomiense TaxID=144191 RepID=UPI0036285604
MTGAPERNPSWDQLARRFAALPLEKRAGFLDALDARGIAFERLPIMPFADGAPDRLSLEQRRLWFLWQLEPESHAYNLGGALGLDGPLDETALARGLDWLVARHETLRTTFTPTEDGDARPVIHPAEPVVLARADVSARAAVEREEAARALAEAGAGAPFDLTATPPVRFGLVRIEAERHLLWFAFHHIVSDGWSIELVIGEFFAAYAAFHEGRDPALPPPPVRYADWAAWQRVRLESGELVRQRDWWKGELGDEHPPIALPTDRPRLPIQSFRGARRRFTLDVETSRAVRALARTEGASLFMVLLAGLHALLARLTGEGDIRVGISSANRTRPETESLPGFFVSTQVIRARMEPALPMRDLIAAVKTATLAAQAHADVPFETLVEALQPERTLSYNPLFQVKFTQQLDTPRTIRAAGLRATPLDLLENVTRFDLSLDVTDRADVIDGVLTYATDLFEPAFADRFVSAYADLMRWAAARPEGPLADWNPADVSALSGETADRTDPDVLTAFAGHVARVPDAIALRAGASSMRFAELDAAATRLAEALRAAGLSREEVVPVLAGLGLDLVVAALGVMRAGGIYAPLDPALPAERLRRLAADARARLVLFDAEGAGAATTLDLDRHAIADLMARPGPLDAPPLPVPLPDQGAYLIYTSGSTGAPKGVLVPHRAIAAYTQAMLTRFTLPQGASFGLVSTPAADLGHTMLFGALVSGRTLHLIETEAAFDADRLADTVQANRIGVLKLVPSHLDGLLATPRAGEILPEAALILGGEALPAGLAARVQRLRPGCRVINHYGPTETSVGVLSHEVATTEAGEDTVPIGRPFAGVYAVILDAHLAPVLPGAVGELYLGGDQLARGYLGRPGITAERFVPDPARPGRRLYRTGDRVRLDGEGAIRFLGRADDQVKIRGHRIELGEVAAGLRALPGIETAYVVPDRTETGRPRLLAYVVGTAEAASGARTALARTLPDAMIPSHVLRLQKAPLTANGKLDRRALPKPDSSPGDTLPDVSRAGGDTAQNALAEIWAEVLRRPTVNLDDNFFALGGDSILSLQIIARAKRRGYRLTPKQVFEHQTVRALAAVAMPLTPATPANTPSCPAEATLSAIWAEVLRRPTVNLDDNFFALGGDSILSLQIIARAKRQGLRLTPKQVFEHQTLRALAKVAVPLATPGQDSGAGSAAASAPADGERAERILAEIWAEVLRRPVVNLDDNFFALGGDSILSLQIIARAKRRGLKLTPKLVFQHQTVRTLAAVAVPLDAAPSPASTRPPAAASRPAVREVPLTPIQLAFLARPVPNRGHWNQSVLLIPRETLDGPALAAVLSALVARHEALRLRIRPRGERWVQGVVATETADLLDIRAVADVADLSAVCAAAHRAIDPGEGPLLRAVLARLPDGSQRLLLTIHHLAVDGVSWRVLLDDLALGLEQRRRGETVALPAPETDFSDYARALLLHAHSEALRDELTYWQAVSGAPLLDSPTRLGEAHRLATILDVAATRAVMETAPAALDARPHEVMTAALACALAGGADSVTIWLEGHGRDPSYAPSDLDRTVGWFTSLYPVRLPVRADRAEHVAAIREALRAVPEGGVGYGLLAHLAEPDLRAAVAAPRGPVFNYLGRIDDAMAGGAFTLAAEDAGPERDPEALMLDPLRIDARLRDGQLRIDWMFDPVRHDAAEAERIVAAFEAALRRLAGAEPAISREVESYPLTPMQQGLLFHARLAPGDTAYVNLLAVTFDGLDTNRFRAAWRAAYARHDILRSTFHARDGAELEQVVHPRVEPAFEEHDWRGMPDLEGRLARLGDAERARGFDLAAAPPMRLVLVRTGEAKWRFLWVRHHILLDGWSSARLLAELAAQYRGEAPHGPAPRFRDAVAWLARRDRAADRAYWRAALASVEEPFRLSSGHAGPPGRGRHLIRLDAERTDALRVAARAKRITLATLVQAAWALVLARRTGRPALFGVTIAGRPDVLPGAEAMLGLFINTLPVLTEPSADRAIGTYLADLQGQNLALREHGAIPLFEVQSLAGNGGEALFDTVLIFENYPVDPKLSVPAPGALAFRDVLVSEDTHYPLTVTVEMGETATIGLAYATEAFAPRDVEAIADAFDRALSAFAAAADEALLGGIGLAPAGDRPLSGPAQTPFVPLAARLRAHAQANPERIAVEGDGGPLSYAELDRGSDAVAARLAAAGVRRGDRVGVFLGRGTAMVLGLLGIVKAGAAYVPLDPDYPFERLTFMAQDAGLAALLTEPALCAAAPAGPWAMLDIEGEATGPVPAFAPHPDDLAYLIYTSGSTGRPKGVMVGHGALANLLAAMASELGIDAKDRLLAVTSLSFDIAALELFLPLTAGARLRVAARAETADPRRLAALLEASEATVMQATPATWRQLRASRWAGRPGLKALCGGEALPADLAAWLAARVGTLWNVYGPTETTIWSSAGRVEAAEGNPDLGHPLAATVLSVLDDALQPVPIGASGELWIGGAGLARGYRGRPGLTAERFAPDPFGAPGARMYRTGDRVRRRADGRLDYLHRLDHQVKIRGYRIEPGEIEAALSCHPAVGEAVVAQAPGGEGLLAYAVAAQGTSPEMLHDHLAARLPAHMLPGSILLLDRLPLTPNGKLDRAALPRPDAVATAGAAPQGETETAVAVIWSDLLGVPRIARDDHFFRLGGHSLTATRMVARIESELGRVVPLKAVFEAPTLRVFAAVVEATGAVDADGEKLARAEALLAELDA